MPRTLSSEARAKMLATAGELLLAEGMAAFSADEVSRRSGVAKTTIYRHFGTSNELLLAAVDNLLGPFPTPDTGNIRSDLLAFADSAMPVFSNLALRRLMLGVLHLCAEDPTLASLHQTITRDRKQPLVEIVERAKARGELPADLETAAAFDHIEGPFVIRWLLEPETFGQLDIESRLDRILAALRA